MSNPLEILKDNWLQAKSLKDASANFCSLATVSSAGEVSVRTLVLREVTDDSVVIFINNTSPKWQQLHDSKSFELLVFWPQLMQQYRVRGEAGEVPVDLMREQWARKPYDAKIIDLYYSECQPQSSVVVSRERLVSDINALKQQYPRDSDIAFPEIAKGIAIKANYVEVWHNSATDRLHERNLYRLSNGEWQQRTLVP